MAPQYESVKVEKIWKQKWLTGLQMVQFECPIGRETIYVLFYHFIRNPLNPAIVKLYSSHVTQGM